MAHLTPPLAIRWIEIQNFRQVDNLRLDFTAPNDSASDIIVLAGPNGCGKTSVLEACLLVLGYPGPLQGSKGRQANRDQRTPWSIRAEVQHQASIYQVECTVNDQTVWTDTETGEKTHTPMTPCMYFSSWRSPKLVGSLPITAGKPGIRPQNTEHNRIWRAKQQLIDSKAHALMTRQKPAFDDDYTSNIKRLNDVWSHFYPDRKEEFTVEPISNDPSEGFDVFLQYEDGRMIPVDALSSGQLELFALFGTLMIAKFHDGIIVIDEPELHLDPQWHTLMLRTIRVFSPSTQLLVATHSPRVYESVMSFQRFFLIPELDPRASDWVSSTGGAPVA